MFWDKSDAFGTTETAVNIGCRISEVVLFDFDKVSGFIFDCDGTLLDSLGAWDVAERDLFAQAGELTQEQEDELHAVPQMRVLCGRR